MPELLDRPGLDTPLAWALLQGGRLPRPALEQLLREAREERGVGGATLARRLAQRGLIPGGELEAVLAGLDSSAIPPAEPAQRRLGEYQLLERLGAGGMGVVYRARHVATGAEYALKALTATDVETISRFVREGEGQARVDHHPNVVRVHTVGREGATCWLVMDLVRGGSLEDRLRAGPLPAPEQAARWLIDLARAVEQAHLRGVLHRDLKPPNVLFEGEVPKLVDFGLAKLTDARSLTASGTLLGTPSYMAPEQVDASRGQVGPPADVYGLGAVLYRCLTGKPPHLGKTVLETLVQVLEAEPAAPRSLRPEVPAALEAACLRALGKDPARRQGSAAELARELEAALAPAVPSSRRRLAAAIGGGLIALALTLSAGLLGGRAPRPAEPAPLAPPPSVAPEPPPPPPAPPDPPPPALDPEWSLAAPSLWFTDRYEWAVGQEDLAVSREGFEELLPAAPHWHARSGLRRLGKLLARDDPRASVVYLGQAALAGDREAAAILGGMHLPEALKPDRLKSIGWPYSLPEDERLAAACMVLALDDWNGGDAKDKLQTAQEALRRLGERVVLPGRDQAWRRVAEAYPPRPAQEPPDGPDPAWSRQPTEPGVESRFKAALAQERVDPAGTEKELWALVTTTRRSRLHAPAYRALARVLLLAAPNDPQRALWCLERATLAGDQAAALTLGCFFVVPGPDTPGGTQDLGQRRSDELAAACFALTSLDGDWPENRAMWVDVLRRRGVIPPQREAAYRLLWRELRWAR